MKRDQIAEAEKIFMILTKGRVIEREAVQNRLTRQDGSFDSDHLKHLIMEALDGPYNVRNASRDPQSQKAWVRCWLLSSLGRIAGNDKQAREYVRRHTAIANEPNEWARYWALESLVVTKAPDLEAIAKNIVPKEGNTLVKRLALVIMASQNDSKAMKEIIRGVELKDWTMLRALRIVPLEEAVSPICAIVASPEFTDATYDSIVALGVIPPEWSGVEEAVSALITCIKACRRHPWWDGMRRKALTALGNLGSPEAIPVLIGELSDSNPSIVYEASQALERIAGVNKATARIVEIASQTGEEAIQQYASALRWMNRDKVAEELESLMLSGSLEQQDTARLLLSEIGGRVAFEKLRARADTMKQHLDALEKTEQGIRELFDSSLREARTGYRLATGMDIIVFLLGIGFVVLCGYLVMNGKETLAGLTGGGGALAILYNLFIANPRRRVQESVEHLMSLKVIFLGYLRQLHQADKAYVRRFLDDSPLRPEEIKQYARIVAGTMQDAIYQIRQYSRKKSGKQGDVAKESLTEAEGD